MTWEPTAGTLSAEDLGGKFAKVYTAAYAAPGDYQATVAAVSAIECHVYALTVQLESARGIAVRLEQELAAADTAGCREFGARALFLQFMKPKQYRTKAMWSQGVNDACRQEWLERWDRVELEIRDAIAWALGEAADGEA